MLGSIDKAVARVRMESCDIHIVVATQHGRNMSHAPTNPVQSRDRMILVSMRAFHYRFTHTVANQAKVGAGTKLDARHGRSLGTVQGTSFQQLTEAWTELARMRSCGIGTCSSIHYNTGSIGTTTRNTQRRGNGRTGRCRSRN